MLTWSKRLAFLSSPGIGIEFEHFRGKGWGGVPEAPPAARSSPGFLGFQIKEQNLLTLLSAPVPFHSVLISWGCQ